MIEQKRRANIRVVSRTKGRRFEPSRVRHLIFPLLARFPASSISQYPVIEKNGRVDRGDIPSVAGNPHLNWPYKLRCCGPVFLDIIRPETRD